MRVLIIGGTHFIGPPVVRRLHESGFDVTVFHRGRTEVNLPKKVAHIHGDRMLLAEHREAFEKLRPDVVVDMAAFTQQEALATMSAFRGIAGRLVTISSQDVYRAYGRFQETEPGVLEQVPLTEEAPLREKLYLYGGTGRGLDSYEKILVERTALSSETLPGTVLRPPRVFGEADYQHRLLLELTPLDDHPPPLLLEKRSAAWRWTRGYVDNVAAAIALAVTNDRATNRIYNVGEQEALSYAEWVRLVGHVARWGGSVVVAPNDSLPAGLNLPRANYDQHLVVDTMRIRLELGYQEPVPRDEALRRTIAWERETRPRDIDKLLDYATEDAALAELQAKASASDSEPESHPTLLP